ncbi:MAG: GspE/PulE family protein [Burkholderiaceae bacterium]|nr:GspE/PulE family protein [Burkholderiaceae bacterium]
MKSGQIEAIPRHAPRADGNAADAIGRPGQRLQLRELVPALVADGLLAEVDASAILRYDGISSVEQPALASIAQRRLRTPAGGPLDIDALGRWLASRLDMEYVHIDPLKVDVARVSEVMSSQYATRFRILPIGVEAGAVTIATAEPFITDWVAELGQVLRKRIRVVLADPTALSRYIAEFFTLARSVRDAGRNGRAAGQENFEQLVELGRSGRNLDANDQHIVTIVDWLWQYAFEQRASDIHLEPRRELGVIRFRIDGVMHNVYQVPAAVLAAMTSRIKLLGRMDVIEKRRPQDGRIKTRSSDGKEIELRLATMPTAFGEKLVMRIFDPEVLVLDFDALGFLPEELAAWQAMAARPNGIILVTGPTGSGKTTTLYTTLKQLATDEVNVCTVEDPIEMVEASFNQMQVQPGIDLGFADGVRALMRQDPDIIMIGEIRDLETAEMAIQAALTGHLVLATLHTNDAPSAVTRMIDLGVPSYLLAATLIGVLAQRLVRRLCPACKQPTDDVSEDRWRGMIRPFRAPTPPRIHRPVGCLECRMTGYRGRLGLYELLQVDEPMQQLVAQGAPLQAIRRHALRHGMRPMRVSGANRIAQGMTTIDEVLRQAPQIEVGAPAGPDGTQAAPIGGKVIVEPG